MRITRLRTAHRRTAYMRTARLPANHMRAASEIVSLPQLFFDRLLLLVAELEAVGREELDAVVLVGVVRGGQHGRQIEAVALDQQRCRRRWQHAAEQRFSPSRAHARGKRGLQHLSGLARIAHDQHSGTIR